MIRVCIVCEGLTEQNFIIQILQPYLSQAKNLYVYPSKMNGHVCIERLSKLICLEYQNFDRITTFVDFYGFQNPNKLSIEQIQKEILESCEKKLGDRFDQRFILPYIQLHEFESLLFTDVMQFQPILIDSWNQHAEEQLLAIRDAYNNPEDINNSPQTAPSKRILGIFENGYSKTEHGPLIAEKIGLTKIREACPGFNRWIQAIENWGY